MNKFHVLAIMRPPFLRHSSRERIIELARTAPGLHVSEIIKRTQLAAGTVGYHLLRLEAEGVIRTLVAGRRRLVFLASDARTFDTDADAMSLLRGKTALAVAEALSQTAPTSMLRLVTRLHESPRAVYYHVKRLREAGLVISTSPTRYRELAPAPQLRVLLARLSRERVGGESLEERTN